MMQGRPLRPALRRSPQKASRSTPASRPRTGDSSEAEVWLHLIKPITAGLIDASVWINHLRAADERLSALLAEDQVLGHPFILGELALGYLRQRDLILRSLQRLPQAAVASDREVLRLIENERLYGRGIGYID